MVPSLTPCHRGFRWGSFLGAAAAATVDGEGFGLATLTGVPTCAFCRTLACGGMTAGGPIGAAAA